MVKVAILYICTGKYDIFWKDFFKTSESYFLPDCEKQYFVFTDATSISYQNNPRIHKIYQQKLGWPFDTLKRFEIFLKAEEKLRNFDYLFFLNANMRFVDRVDESILPSHEEGLLAVLHPYFYNKERSELPYEANPLSAAYIAPDEGKCYFMGGFNGGTSPRYLELIKDISLRIQKDLSKGIIARWHDESHLNKYLLERSVKILTPQYGYPEGFDLDLIPKIIILDKGKFGGHSWLRDKKGGFLKDTVIKVKHLIKRVL